MSTRAPVGSEGFSRRPKGALTAALLFALAVVLYWPATGYDFTNYDDQEYVTRNGEVRGGVSPDGLLWASTAIVSGNWHPVTLVSHMIDCDLFGLDPAGHHLVSVLIHAVNGALLFVVWWRMTASAWSSALVAALFLVHPLNVQSVAWISERKNLLSTLFWLLTMLAYAGYARRGGRLRYLGVVVFLVLGLMAKPTLVTLPFVLLLLDIWPLGRTVAPPAREGARGLARLWGAMKDHITANRRLLAEKLPLLPIVLASSLLTFRAQLVGDTVFSLSTIPIGARLANAVVAYGWYVEKMLWPAGLAAFYPHPGASLSWFRVAVALFFLIAVTALVLRAASRRLYLLVGWLWYLGTLVPVIGLVQVGGQAVADRYAYVPLVGLFVMIAWGVAELERAPRPRTTVLAALALLLLCVDARRQMRHWQNSLSLFAHAVEVTKGNYLAHNNLGTALYRLGRTDEAMVEFARAIAANPGFLEAQFNFANGLMGQGRLAEAAERFKLVLRLDPNYVRALNNLGAVYIRMGRFVEAIPPLRRAVELQPGYEEAWFNLGKAEVSRP